MKDISWDDLQLFFQVAESGGLSAAARATGLSAPTLGRRMLSLEQQTGRALFLRQQTGYALTRDGEALLARVRGMQAAAAPVRAFLRDSAERPWVRLSAGTATASFLADRLGALSRPGDDFRLQFVTTEARLDIAHREIDLGIRNRPAEQGNLASRPLGRLCFAPFCARGAQPGSLGWVAVEPGAARHPAAHWLHAQGHRIEVLANSAAMVHQLVRSGAGVGVMPCLLGGQRPGAASRRPADPRAGRNPAPRDARRRPAPPRPAPADRTTDPGLPRQRRPADRRPPPALIPSSPAGTEWPFARYVPERHETQAVQEGETS